MSTFRKVVLIPKSQEKIEQKNKISKINLEENVNNVNSSTINTNMLKIFEDMVDKILNQKVYKRSTVHTPIIKKNQISNSKIVKPSNGKITTTKYLKARKPFTL
jgi:hypothetical protein